MTILKLFLNAIIKNIKIHNSFLILFKFQNLWNIIKVFIKKYYGETIEDNSGCMEYKI
jgi:hypothetical protein